MAEPGCKYGHEVKAQLPYIKKGVEDLHTKMDKLNGRMWKLVGGLLLLSIAAILTNWRG